MQSIDQHLGLRELLLLIALSIVWGGSFFFVGVAVHHLPRFTLVALRVGLAAIALNLIVAALKLRMPADAKLWAAFFAMGLFNNAVPFSLIVWGQKSIASGLASVLNATTPLFTVVLAHFLTRDEKMAGKRLLGVLAGFGGVVVIFGPEALAGLGRDSLAQLAVLGAALCYALSGIFGRRFRSQGVPPLVTACGQVTAAAVLLVPLAVWAEQPWTIPAPPLEVWGAVSGLALLSTALAYVLYFRILAAAGANNVALVTFLIPISAILLGSLVLGERLDSKHFLGMGLIVLGLAAIDGRALGFLRRRPGADRRRAPRL